MYAKSDVVFAVLTVVAASPFGRWPDGNGAGNADGDGDGDGGDDATTRNAITATAFARNTEHATMCVAPNTAV